MQDDSRIVSLLQKRDEQALAQIRASYGALSFQLAFRITGNSEDAEECVSDALMNVWNTVPPQKPDSLRAYLLALVRRAAVDKYKTAHRLKRGGTEFAASLDELSEILSAPERVEHQVEQRAVTAAITEWLRTLNSEDRKLFLKRYFLSASVQETAEECGMNTGALKMKLMRLRRKLKEYLEKEGLL